jgi:hypothetical protein
MSFFSTRRRAAALLAFFLLITGLFVWLNLDVPAAGIVQNALLDQDNPYYQAQQQVDKVKGLKQADAMSFVLSFPNGIDENGMRQLVQMTADLRKRFPQGVVWSLAADSYAYKSTAQQLESTPHLSPSWLDQAGQFKLPMSMDAWKRDVAADPAAYGLLVSKDFKVAQIMLWMPSDYNELRLVQQVAEYLEQRPISQLEWLLLKGDIKPVAAYANVTLGGWSVGRGLMHFALMSDVLFYSTIGLIIATLAALLALKSLKQALYSSACILVSFILVRGSITLASMLGLEFYGAQLSERVYFLLVLSAMIVGGISFNIRALERFNEVHAQQPDAPHHSLWAKVEGMHLPLNVAAIIALLNFATLPQIGIRGIMEVGVLSAVGIIYQRILVSAMLPALQLTFGGVAGERSIAKIGAVQHAWERAITAVPAWCHQMIVRLNARHPYGAAIAAALACSATVGAALAVVAHDMGAADKWILVQEKPIDYLPHTIIDRGRQLLNEPGNIGFGRLSYLVQPRAAHLQGGDAVDDPQFLRQAEALQQRLAALPGARGANSVLDTLSYLTVQDATMAPGNGKQRALPATAQQAHDQLAQINWDLSQPALAHYLWTADGLVLYLSHPADNSTELRQFADRVERVAASEFPQLRVLPFGALHTYHQTDLYISEGKPLNVLTSFPLVVLCAGLWLMWSMRRRQGQGAQPALRPWLTAIAMTVPFLFAYSVIVVLMAALKIPLDQATACATALGINAAIDFDLYLIDDYRSALGEGKSAGQALHYALAERGHITLTDAALNGICFSFLLCSPFLPIQRLGAIMLVMLATCALGALLLMPALLPLCSRLPRQGLSPVPVAN